MSRPTNSQRADRALDDAVAKFEGLDVDKAVRWGAHIPRGPLAAFVDMIWYYESRTTGVDRERILPAGTLQFVVRLGSASVSVYDAEGRACLGSAGTLLNGAQARPFVIDKADQDTLIGVQFKPGGAFPFLGVPAAELLDAHVGLDCLWGGSVHELRERLWATRTVGAKMRIMEAWLLGIATTPLDHHPAVKLALRALTAVPGRPHLIDDPTPAIGALAAAANLSKRRFIEVFKDQVGLTPKLFARLQRFQRTIRALPQGPVCWTDLALAQGFCDQAHLIRDFRDFSGVTPTAFQALRGEHLQHLPFPD